MMVSDMAETPVSLLLCKLYELSVSEAKNKTGEDRVNAGHKFEDKTAQEIYHFARKSSFDPNPPRTTLNLPTLSGNVHQFDASFEQGDTIFIVECKNTKEAAKEYLYTFNAKIKDYVDALSPGQSLSFRGFFLSTVQVAYSAWRYGLAYGIRIVDPDSPPPEYVIANCSDVSLVSAFEGIQEKMLDLSFRLDATQNARQVLDEYRFLCSRWKDEC
jgi:hypothetical protein